MGSGLSGGPLTGNVTTAALPPAPAGQSAVLSGPLGAGASDVVTKIGSTVADGSVNAAAKLTSIRTGIGGTEVEKLTVIKDGTVANASGRFIGASTATGYVEVNDVSGTTVAYGATSAVTCATNTVTSAALGMITSRSALVGAADICNRSGSNAAANVETTAHAFGDTLLTVANYTARVRTSGRIDQSGTDSTGTPGAAVIDKPTGKSAIAIGAASVTITNALCAATSRVMISPHARDATCTDLIVVPGAGSFVVSGAAAATAAVPFSWEVSNII